MNRKIDQNQTVKIAAWYIVCNIIVRGLGFISSPIFTRLMTQEEYGEFSNFLSWESVLVIIISFQLQATIPRAKYDFSHSMDDYISSLTLLSSFLALLFLGGVFIFRSLAVSALDMDEKYIWILCIYLFFYPAFLNLQVKHRIYSRYKLFVALALVTAFLRVGIAYLLIKAWDDALWGRTIGYCIPVLTINIILWISILKKGNKPSFTYLRYAIPLALPMFINGFAGNLLGTSDRIMIKRINGASENAIYSIGYQYAMLLSIVWTALNQAWTPWLFDRLHDDNIEAVRDKSTWYVMAYSVFIIPALLIAPEMILFMGGAGYKDAQTVVPAVLVGCVFQFIYGLFINLETYEKKNWIALWGTIGACVTNIGLNALLLPKFGYKVAAYTTLFGYFLLMVFHYLFIRKMKKYNNIYDLKMLRDIVFFIFAFHACCFFLYEHTFIRISILVLYCLIIGILLAKKWTIVKEGLKF